MNSSFSNPGRATAATLALAMALMGAAPTVAFCQAMCLPAQAQTAHPAASAPAHHHQSHASQSRQPVSVLMGSLACKTLVQVALLRRQDAMAADRQVETAAAVDTVIPSLDWPANRNSASRFPDRHGPPLTAPPLVPLRV
ncbi:MAG: hypothetical protein ACRD24_13980 [Terriglobales bacterium]